MNSIKLEWKRGDWAAYFGLMTNNLTNLLTMMGLLIFRRDPYRNCLWSHCACLWSGGAGGQRLLRTVWPADGKAHRA